MPDNFVYCINAMDALLVSNNEGKIYQIFKEVFEKPLLERVLLKTSGNQLKAARILGINRNTLRSKVKKYNIGGA